MLQVTLHIGRSVAERKPKKGRKVPPFRGTVLSFARTFPFLGNRVRARHGYLVLVSSVILIGQLEKRIYWTPPSSRPVGRTCVEDAHPGEEAQFPKKGEQPLQQRGLFI